MRYGNIGINISVLIFYYVRSGPMDRLSHDNQDVLVSRKQYINSVFGEAFVTRTLISQPLRALSWR